MKDPVGDELAAALDERWPDAIGRVERKPSKSVVEEWLYVLHWHGLPTMKEVREFLEGDQRFSHLSVMFAKRPGES